MFLNNKIFISPYQLMIMICTLLSFSNMLSLPMALSEISRRDAWISFFLPTLYGFLLAFLLFLLMRRYPGKNLFEISKAVCGKWIGGFLNVWLILYLFYDLVINLRLYTDYFNSSILLRTPVEFILLLTVSLLIYFGNGSIQDVARSAALFFPIFFILHLLLPFMLLNEIDLRHMLPSLSEGAALPLRGGLLGMGAFGDIIAVGAFLNNLKHPRGLYISMKSGIAISCFILTTWTLLVITTIGHTTASRMIYIGWVLVQQIHITDFLDRVDLFIVSLWLPNLFIKYCILYLSVLVGLASFTKSKSYKEYNVLTGMILTMTCIVLFANVGEVVKLYNYGMWLLTLPIQILFFGAVFIGLILKKKTDVKIGNQGKKNAWGSVWFPVFGCAAAIGMSNVLGNDRGIYGIYCAVFYFIFLLLVVFFSLREFKQISDKI